jgi:hypothetical protein
MKNPRSTRATALKGYLLVTMEPPPTMGEEFDDWYDTEHVPERLRVKGFESGRRYVCTDGWPRYMAFYELRSVDVIGSPGYAAIANQNFSPWTKRILSRVRGFYRSFGEQIYCAGEMGPAARLATLRMSGGRGAMESKLLRAATVLAQNQTDVAGVRLLRSTQPEKDYMLVVATNMPIGAALKTEPASLAWLRQRAVSINEYATHGGRVPGAVYQ